MKVAIDCQIQPAQGGVGEYTLGLVRELLAQGRHEYVLFTNPLTRFRLGTALDRAEVIRSETSPMSPNWLLKALPQALGRIRPHLFHGPAFLLPFQKVCPYVATVHDMIYRLFPRTMTWRRRLFWRVTMWNTWRRADRIFADSDNTRRDIARLICFPDERVEVLPAGLDPVYHPEAAPEEWGRLRARYGIPEKYFLSVSTLEPRKNLTLVIRAFKAFRQAGGGMELVLAGPRGWLDSPLFRAARASGLEAHIHFTGWVEPEDLPGLYRGARALVFPSLYEGFGLPVLEAMACGTPVIASRVASLPEVGGDAALYIEPLTAEALAERMQRLDREQALRTRCRTLGLQQARRFNWQTIAAQAAEAYARVAAGAKA